MTLYFRQYYSARVVKRAWCWHIKQTHRSMEQNREPGNKLTHQSSINPQQEERMTNDKKSVTCYVSTTMCYILQTINESSEFILL